MAARIGGAGDAYESLELGEPPSRDDADARAGVARQASEDPVGSSGEAGGFGAIHDRGEGTVQVREENEPAVSPEGLLQLAAEGQGLQPASGLRDLGPIHRETGELL